MNRNRVAEGIAHDLRLRGVPVVQVGWRANFLCVKLKTGEILPLWTHPQSTPASLEANREAALAVFQKHWADVSQALEDRLLKSCTACGARLEATGLVYLLDRSVVCPGCYEENDDE